ncbi:hypothetical protein Nmel_014032, partial [Mimus melanotis]
FQRIWWGKQRAEEELCTEASSVNPGLHLAPDAWLLVQGWRSSCPLKPKGRMDIAPYRDVSLPSLLQFKV